MTDTGPDPLVRASGIKVKGLPIGLRADISDKPPLLLVHGLLSSRNHWTPNTEALRTRYRLVIAELPGHGEARPCTDPKMLAPDTLVDALDYGRRFLGIERWHICGQSFGSALTLRLALKYPATVGAQIWTNANRSLSEPVDPAIDRARATGVREDGIAGIRKLPFHPRHGKRFDPEIRALLEAEADRVDVPTLAGLFEHTVPQATLRDRFERTTVPTLLINGRLESGFQPTRQLAKDLLASLDIVDLPAGHAVNIEQPSAFNTAVLDFLSGFDRLL